MARAGGGVEVGGEGSVGDPDPLLQATAATRARLSAMPKIILRIDVDPGSTYFSRLVLFALLRLSRLSNC